MAATPLRVRLVAAVLLLVVLALAGSGWVATATLRSYLIGRVDSQLAAVAAHGVDGVTVGSGRDRGGAPSGGAPSGGAPSGGAPSGAAQSGGRDGGGAGDGGPQGDRGRVPSAFVIEVVGAPGRVVYGPTSNLIDSGEPLPELPDPKAVLSQIGRPQTFTVGAVRGGGRWRVAAQPVTLVGGGRGVVLVAQSLHDVDTTVAHLAGLLALIGAGAVVLVAGAGYVIVRASLRPLRAVERTAAEIAAGDLSHRVPPAPPRTEVGHLSAALNTMLGEIERAFAERAASERRMRRFVADASHELRTPLTVIRGFAELYRQGAAAQPGEVDRLMRRIEDEAARMGLLVDDLLLLARLDQERPLERRPVDVLTLASDAVADARALDPDRPVALRVRAGDEPPVVLGDEARLRQVLRNLLTNALRHTPAGTPVTVTVGTGSSEQLPGPVVTIEVRDEGPGLSPEAAARVFERFYRADAARSRDDGGTGLGLAIVAALVGGHGGRVGVDTAPGEGACFRVDLPLAEAVTPD